MNHEWIGKRERERQAQKDIQFTLQYNPGRPNKRQIFFVDPFVPLSKKFDSKNKFLELAG